MMLRLFFISEIFVMQATLMEWRSKLLRFVKIIKGYFVLTSLTFIMQKPPLQVHCTAKEDLLEMCVLINMIVRFRHFYQIS